jgi:hypothetical protein
MIPTINLRGGGVVQRETIVPSPHTFRGLEFPDCREGENTGPATDRRIFPARAIEYAEANHSLCTLTTPTAPHRIVGPVESI